MILEQYDSRDLFLQSIDMNLCNLYLLRITSASSAEGNFEMLLIRIAPRLHRKTLARFFVIFDD
jgi:hypothetical protein